MNNVVSFALLCTLTLGSVARLSAVQNDDCLHDRYGRKPGCCDVKKRRFERRMDQYIQEKMAQNSAVGLSIVVVENNRIVYEKGFGYADRENSVAVNGSTLFHVGSITKLFTGIGIMQLAQKGLIDIDAPIQQYLPEFSIKYHTTTGQPITLRSMMAHQSGIMGDKLANEFAPEYPADDFRTYPVFAQNEYAPYSPDYITAYSNFAVSLLGLVIERVTREKYEDYIYNNILKPCRMMESGFDPKNEHAKLLAQGYDAEGNLYPYYYIAVNPAGFLASSSDNMGRFIKMILGDGHYFRNRILYPNTLNSMYQQESGNVPMYLRDDYMSPYNFGLSWMLGNESFGYLGRVVGHGGNLPPYNSSLLIAKDQDIGVFVTANKDDVYPDDVASFALAVAAEIFKGLHKPALPEVPPVIAMPEHIQNYYSGTYCMTFGLPIEVFSKNDTLYFQELHSDPLPLVYHADNWVSISIDNTIVPDIRFSVRDINGQRVLCAEQRDTFSVYRMIVGNNFVPEELSREVLERTGLYAETSSGEPAMALYPDVLLQSGAPVLIAADIISSTPYVLNPAENATFIVQGLGRSAQETAYFTGDTLNFSGYKMIKFDTRQAAERSVAKPGAVKAPEVKKAEKVIEDLKKNIMKKRRM